MRFSAALEQFARLGQAPAKPVDAARTSQPRPQPKPKPTERKPVPELPADLDQRVRLIGEW